MTALPRCDHPSGLEQWIRTALAPYYPPAPSDTLQSSALADLASDVPILEDPHGASCVWAGRLGAIAAWQAHNEDGALVARAATAPKQDLRVVDAIVEAHHHAYHQSAIGSGGRTSTAPSGGTPPLGR